jgi:hypothetical protein
VTDEAFGDLYFFSGSAGDCSQTNTYCTVYISASLSAPRAADLFTMYILYV